MVIVHISCVAPIWCWQGVVPTGLPFVDNMDMVVASSSCDDPSSASQCINLGYRTIVSRRSQNWTILPCLFIA